MKIYNKLSQQIVFIENKHFFSKNYLEKLLLYFFN